MIERHSYNETLIGNRGLSNGISTNDFICLKPL